jgi:hypothetical protein
MMAVLCAVGAPGMPEWGNLPIPKKLLKTGVRDMLRLSDARMSGTHYGTCVLHISPESAVGGPLALVQTGDTIELDVAQRRLHLNVSEDVLAQRRLEWKAPVQTHQRGYAQLYQRHVTQAHEGCDFDFLQGTAPTPEPLFFETTPCKTLSSLACTNFPGSYAVGSWIMSASPVVAEAMGCAGFDWGVVDIAHAPGSNGFDPHVAGYCWYVHAANHTCALE